MKLILVEDCNSCPYNDVFVADVNNCMSYCPLISFPLQWKKGFRRYDDESKDIIMMNDK